MVGDIEVHHRIPRHLLVAYDRVEDHPEIDSGGIELAFRFMSLAMDHGVPDSIGRENLKALIDDSCVYLDRDEHRKLHASEWQVWGKWGGRTTLSRYGRSWFSQLARRRWKKITAQDLELLRAKLLSEGVLPL